TSWKNTFVADQPAKAIDSAEKDLLIESLLLRWNTTRPTAAFINAAINKRALRIPLAMSISTIRQNGYVSPAKKSLLLPVPARACTVLSQIQCAPLREFVLGTQHR